MDDERGSGRTTRQLAALPDGGVYLVPRHHPFVGYCKAILRHLGRSPNAITFVTSDLARQSIFGRRIAAWDVDHAYLDLTGHRGLYAYDLLHHAAGRGPGA